jgi:membrane protein DedA with SNARE-associated domain
VNLPLATDPTDPDTPHPGLPLDGERQQLVRLSLWGVGILGTASLIGVAFSLYLVNHSPLLLIALSPLGRHMVLVAPAVHPVAFVSVLVARRLLFYFACYTLGSALGPAGIPWLEARSTRAAAFVRWMEGIFSRWSRLVVLVMSGPTVSALAGMSGMRRPVFLLLATVGLVVRCLLVLGFAAWIEEYIEIARTWIEEVWVPGTVLMVAGVVLYRWKRGTPFRGMAD